uniref:adenine phosphoribosyltransferase n=1 Tax=Acrobeloides nanus TaxID=290746 RepID=A0A914C0X1_9BILA
MKVVMNFPKIGISFRDIMPLVYNTKLLDELCHAIAKHIKDEYGDKIDVVAACFLFGPQVAIILGVPFVPIRKKGKLPGKVIQATYIKEYGQDTVEIQAGVLKTGSRVFLFDDLLGTGGTIRASIDLIEQESCTVVEAFFLIELAYLGGRTNIPKNINVYSLFSFLD